MYTDAVFVMDELVRFLEKALPLFDNEQETQIDIKILFLFWLGIRDLPVEPHNNV